MSINYFDLIGSLVVTTEPAEEPVLTHEFAQHQRIDLDDEDELIDLYLKTARIQAEKFCRRAFVTTEYKYLLDRFPGAGDQRIVLPRSKVTAIASVKYKDDDGDLQTVDSADYETDLDSEPARIRPVNSNVWPTPGDRFSAVQIEFTAGYGTRKQVPEGIKTAIKYYTAHYYENREPLNVRGGLASVGSFGQIFGQGSEPLATMPFVVSTLLHEYRVF